MRGRVAVRAVRLVLLLHRLVRVSMLCVQLHNFNLQLSALGRELLEQFVLLREFDRQLVGLHIQSGCLQFGFDQLLLDFAVLNAQLLQLRDQVCVFGLQTQALLLELLQVGSSLTGTIGFCPLVLGQETLELSHLGREHLMLDTEGGHLPLGHPADGCFARLACLCLFELFEQLAVLLLEERNCLHVLVFQRRRVRVHLCQLFVQPQHLLGVAGSALAGSVLCGLLGLDAQLINELLLLR